MLIINGNNQPSINKTPTIYQSLTSFKFNLFVLMLKYFFPHDNDPEHSKALDDLRGIAVMLVLLSHASNVGIHFQYLLNFQKIGKAGVYLFFVLSAYLLDRQIAIAFINNKSSKLYWKNYFVRRFLRIYPLFVIALIFQAII